MASYIVRINRTILNRPWWGFRIAVSLRGSRPARVLWATIWVVLVTVQWNVVRSLTSSNVIQEATFTYTLIMVERLRAEAWVKDIAWRTTIASPYTTFNKWFTHTWVIELATETTSTMFASPLCIKLACRTARGLNWTSVLGVWAFVHGGGGGGGGGGRAPPALPLAKPCWSVPSGWWIVVCWGTFCCWMIGAARWGQDLNPADRHLFQMGGLCHHLYLGTLFAGGGWSTVLSVVLSFKLSLLPRDFCVEMAKSISMNLSDMSCPGDNTQNSHLYLISVRVTARW